MPVILLKGLETGSELHIYGMSSQVLDRYRQKASNQVSICSIDDHEAVWKKSARIRLSTRPWERSMLVFIPPLHIMRHDNLYICFAHLL